MRTSAHCSRTMSLVPGLPATALNGDERPQYSGGMRRRVLRPPSLKALSDGRGPLHQTIQSESEAVKRFGSEYPPKLAGEDVVLADDDIVAASSP